MEEYKTSTKSRPLFFFESFINNDNLKGYEDKFYNEPINPSQESFRDLGYIIYINDLYINDEPFKPVRVYFKSNLESLLKTQLNLTNKLLIERRDELEYQNTKSDIFLSQQLIRVHNLKVGSESIDVCKELILEVLDELESNIKVIGGNIIKSTLRLAKVKTNNPYFEPVVGRATLVKLYDIAYENGILDDEEISQEDFLNVFMSNNPEDLERKIRFKCKTREAVFFLNSIEILFKKFSSTKIERSKSFYTKRGYMLNHNIIDKESSYLRNNDNSKYLTLKRELEKITNK